MRISAVIRGRTEGGRRTNIVCSYGQQTYRFSIGVCTATPAERTITVDVIKPNGSVQDRRSSTLADLFASVPVAA